MRTDRCGLVTVSGNLLRTRRHTIALDEIDKVSVVRPLALVLGPASALMTLICAVFWADWYPGEILVLIGASMIFAGLAACVGELKVHSLSLREASVFGPVWQLDRARAEIEQSIFASRPKAPATAARKEASDP